MHDRTVTLDSVVRFREEVLFRELDGEAVLLELDSGRYFGLDEVGTRIWSLLSEDGRARPVLGHLVKEFEAASDRLESDLLAFLEELADERLIDVS